MFCPLLRWLSLGGTTTIPVIQDRICILLALATLVGEEKRLHKKAGQTVLNRIRCVSLNALSLVCGLGGNIFLLFNFTRRVRYIIALPMTIILWYFATFIVSQSAQAFAIEVH